MPLTGSACTTSVSKVKVTSPHGSTKSLDLHLVFTTDSANTHQSPYESKIKSYLDLQQIAHAHKQQFPKEV